jgi:hypothetical protein
MVTFSSSFKEAPLAEYDMVRARTMLRNNRMFQSLGIGAIASMLSKSNVVQDSSAITCEESGSAMSQGESSDYNPNDDKVIDEEEVDNILVEKNVKVLNLILFGGVGIFVCYLLCFLSLYAHVC